MNSEIETFEKNVAAHPPESWYDIGRKEFLVQDGRGQWMPLTETQFKRSLRGAGISGQSEKQPGLSRQDEVILNIQRERNVVWSGPLAGYRMGFHEMCGTRVLVTSSPRIIEPVEGNWDTLRQVIDGVIGGTDGEQVIFFLCWVKVAYEALRAGLRQPGQALVMCGPHGCGKSLLQQLITEVLGGRVAKPYQAMTGGTAFNADLFGAEHWCVEDEAPSTDIRARRAFGNSIKNVTVNVSQRLHPKHRDAIVLQPFWRMTVSLNDEAENVMVLPPIDDSLEDKLIIFRAKRGAMPMPTASAVEREAFWDRLTGELPAMLAHLVKMEIPADLRSERFGVTHYHHPQILRMLDDVAPESRLLALLDAVLFNVGKADSAHVVVKKHDQYEGTAETIASLLTSNCSGYEHEARRLLSWNNAAGTYLGRLAKRFPERVKQVRTADSRNWRIAAPGSVLAAPGSVLAAPAGVVPVAGDEAGMGEELVSP